MPNKTKILLLVMLAGIITVALPDTDIRLFSLSKDHGPSLTDTIGLLLILVPYTILVREVWKGRKKLRVYQDTLQFKAVLFISGLGLGLVVASVAGDIKSWWILGAALLAGAQAILFFRVLQK